MKYLRLTLIIALIPLVLFVFVLRTIAMHVDAPMFPLGAIGERITNKEGYLTGSNEPSTRIEATTEGAGSIENQQEIEHQDIIKKQELASKLALSFTLIKEGEIAPYEKDIANFKDRKLTFITKEVTLEVEEGKEPYTFIVLDVLENQSIIKSYGKLK